MKKQEEEIIKIKVAISLRNLLNNNKDYSQKTGDKKDIVDSHEKISIAADIRKATVTDAFSGMKKSTMVTIILIVEAMGFSLKEYGAEYNKITIEQINTFKQNIINNKI